MQCPLCNTKMVTNAERALKSQHNSIKCPNCMFVIFYRGINGLEAKL
ncbi:MAG: hypothetical protein QMC67_13750 [Candidatus Wallbacteria bacterium]